jgi:hypothetical protein
MCHHPLFIILVEDTSGSAKRHHFTGRHQKKHKAFKNYSIKSIDNSFDQTGKPFYKFFHELPPVKENEICCDLSLYNRGGSYFVLIWVVGIPP